MIVLVTGSTGFIGKRLVCKLAEQGNIVHALYRSDDKIENMGHKNIRFFKGTLNDLSSLEAAMKDCHHVYHLAAFARVWTRDPGEYYTQNIDGTKKILECALDLGVRKIVCVSTAGVFGPSAINSVITENSPYPENHSTHYDRSKYQAEILALEFARKGLPVVVVNPTRVFGPGPLTAVNATARLIDAYSRGRLRFMPGWGKNIGNYVLVDDVVDGLIKAMERGQAGKRYLLGGDNISFRDLLFKISAATGKKYHAFPVPFPLLMLVSKLMVLWASLSGTDPLITPEFLRKFRHNYLVSSDLAKKELDYRPASIETSINRTLQWLHKERLTSSSLEVSANP